MFGFEQEQIEHPVFIRRSSALVNGFRHRAGGAQLGCDEVGLLCGNVRDELAATIRAAKFSRFNVEAPENFEDRLFPLAELARKIDDGDQLFEHIPRRGVDLEQPIA